MVFGSEQPAKTAPGLVESILKYRGTGGKEDLRDADYRVRQSIADNYKALVTRVESVGRQLADARRLDAIKAVDDFAQSLQHFVDRVRTATYGYSGLWSEMNPDSTALDQLRQFDDSLLVVDPAITTAVTDLETAAAQGGDLPGPAKTGANAARALLARFDLRGQILTSGSPIDRESALKALGTGGPTPQGAFNLTTGDTLSILGDDYIVDAKIGVSGANANFRLFRLQKDADEWLFVPETNASSPARVHIVQAPVAGEALTVDGAPMTASGNGTGQGQIVGSDGNTGARAVEYTLLSGDADSSVVGLILDWGGERQAFAGKTVHADDIEIFGTPPGEPVLN